MEEIEKLLVDNNQEYLLKIINLCPNEKKENLINQIKSINFEQISKLYEISKKLNSGETQNTNNDKIEPIKVVDKYNIDKEYSKELVDIGEDVLKNGEYAVVTMAGRSRN